MSNSPVSDRQAADVLQCSLFAMTAIWHTSVLIMAALLYLLIKNLKLKGYVMLIIGMVMAASTLGFDLFYLHGSKNITEFMVQGFRKNIICWKLFYKFNFKLACYYEYRCASLYWLGMPLLLASILLFIQKTGCSPHANALQSLQKGRLPKKTEISHHNIQKKLRRLNDAHCDGVALGVSKWTGKNIIIPDAYINQMLLVLGTTGSGKTITVWRFFIRALIQGYPLILIDGKPTDENVTRLMQCAEQYHRPFYGFNCGHPCDYNPFSHGSFTELKDKIMTLKDQWENDYYRTVAEDYLQTTIEVFLKLDMPITLKSIAAALDYKYLTDIVRDDKDPHLIERIKLLQHYERSALTGLQAHLNVLAHSELGQYLTGSTQGFDLQKVINTGGVAYFALPALRYPSFAKALGKLVINDIKTVIDTHTSTQPIFMIFDEFSVFAGEQVLNLVNMGRGKGIHAVFGTQGLADLSKISPDFESQLLNCVNTIICHKLNDSISAERIANWIGTKDGFDVTSQFGGDMSEQALGSVSLNKSFIVHPDEIKMHLKRGEAFYISKVKNFQVDKLMIKL